MCVTQQCIGACNNVCPDIHCLSAMCDVVFISFIRRVKGYWVNVQVGIPG